MPKPKLRAGINLNLLRPQSNPEKIPVKMIFWLLSFGRYIFIFVEALVLLAFVARFKLDADLQAKKEAIDQQVPYVESLRPYEILIRNTQLKLATIGSVKRSSFDWANTLKKIADQTPVSVKVTAINIEKGVDNTSIHIAGQTQVNSDITTFISGLKEDPMFGDVAVANVGLEQGVIKFTINASAKTVAGKSL